MSFTTESLEIEPGIELSSSAYVTQTLPSFTGSSVEVEPEIEISSAAYVAQTLPSFTGSSVEIVPEIQISSAVYLANSGAGSLRLFSKTVIVEPFVLPPTGVPSAHFTQGLEIAVFIPDPVINVVPSPRNGGYEVIYPITPLHSTDTIINQTDAVLWKRLQLTAIKTFDLIRFKIRRQTFDAMVDFFESNLNEVVELYIPGIYPFGKNYARSYVRVVNYNSGFLESENVYRIDVLFQFTEGIA